jgi:hypothetical protein
MTSDLTRILAGKTSLWQRLASRSIVDKLRMLDELRERELAIRGRSSTPGATADRPPVAV